MATNQTNGHFASAESEEHAVIVSLKLSNNEWGSRADELWCRAIDLAVERSVDRSGVGEYDGMARGLGHYEIFTYGPDADALADVVLRKLRFFRPRRGSFVIVRRGGPGTPETRIDL